MNTIKLTLQKKGLTQTWLAEQIGKSFNMVNSYAQNRRQPSIELLIQIAHALDVDVKELLVSTKKR
jgi:transcriptional regulator with XRE-family HTH domain